MTGGEWVAVGSVGKGLNRVYASLNGRRIIVAIVRKLVA